ncbi:MerR family transcriptional regulator [Paenibacillus taichungensis]|uniref:MerR family DNA-binding transcriptional regulator n=1 Tax=Paenibacillus taichungensis TaxID=484184 RepID=A0A329QS55_9BACL|nr:MerR family transcriptional regulator [Paenibacillus taichungensis]RAW13508.1 MerR family DNA-binding transcriptional regulator [Paenibacillus taichungensis]
MVEDKDNYKERKVITIGTVCDLTGLSARKIRYYEERGLIFPERSTTGNRKYSFKDIEMLMEIANHLEDGFRTFDIKQDQKKKNSVRLYNTYTDNKNDFF